MPRALRRLILLLLLPAAASCSSLRFGKRTSRDTPPPAEPVEVYVGTIELVNPEQDFVLIGCEVVPALPDAAELTAVTADGSESRLVLAPERKGRHLTADIREGRPQVNALVYHLRKPGSAPPASAKPAATPPLAPPSAPGGLPVLPALPSLPGLPPGYTPPGS